MSERQSIYRCEVTSYDPDEGEVTACHHEATWYDLRTHLLMEHGISRDESDHYMKEVRLERVGDESGSNDE